MGGAGLKIRRRGRLGGDDVVQIDEGLAADKEDVGRVEGNGGLGRSLRRILVRSQGRISVGSHTQPVCRVGDCRRRQPGGFIRPESGMA